MTTKSARTRERILLAAAEVLASRGYASTTLETIAERAEMKAGSLYYHFPSKDELVAQVLLDGVAAAHDSVVAAVANVGGAARAIDRVEVAIVAHLEAIISSGPFTKANIHSYGQVPEAIAARVRAAQRSYGETWRALIAEAMASGDIRTDLDATSVRLLLLGAMNWSVEWVATEGPMSSRELADDLIEMVLHGLVPRG